MSYKDTLKRQIQQLESRIAQAQGDKEVLQAELQKLQLAEFEEDMREDTTPPQTLLKG
jgi:TolA-binding protein